MSLGSWLPWRRSRQNGADFLGLICSPGRLSAAVVRTGATGERPRMVAHASFASDPTLAELGRWLRAHKLSGLPANLLLPGEDYQILHIDAPDVPREELAQATRWRIKDMIDFPVEEACVECLRMPAPDGNGLSQNAWAVVAHRERVRSWMERARAVQIDVQSVDIPELAMRNLLALHHGGPGALALLRIGSSRASLIVVWRGELCTFRRFDLNIDSFATQDLVARQALFERLGLEVQRTADAFERQFHGAVLDRVLVEQSVPGIDLVQQLAPQVTLRVQPYDLDQTLEIDLEPGEPVAPAAAAAPAGALPGNLIAIGAALRRSLETRDAGAPA